VSHTNTGEWQSFELRMRRRRAERLVLRADVAADNGCLAEAREALAEARQLAPTLPDFERIEQKLAAAERAERLEPTPSVESPALSAPELSALELPTPQPLIEDLPLQEPSFVVIGSSSAWKGTLMAIAASILLLAAGGLFAYTLLGPETLLTSHGLPATAQLVDARPAVFTAPAAAAPPTLDPLPAVATADPTGTTGIVDAASRVDTPTPEAAESPRLVNASLPSADVQRSGDVVPTADSKPIAPPPPSDQPRERLERVETRETPDPPKLPVNTVADTRLAESAVPAPTVPPPPPVSTPASAASAPAAAAAPPTIAPDTLVKATLDGYAAAYNRLDADAAQRVWPGVNRDALARAFDGLASQRVSLGNCRIDVTGDQAQAQCAGSMTWRPKVGGGEGRTDQRTWTFQLTKSGQGWQIVNARVQNR
jgi:hypothetical protein